MPTEKFELVVPFEHSGRRLDQVLSILCPEHSRSRLQSWIRDGFVTVDNEKLRQRDSVHEGQVIRVNATIEAAREFERENIPLDIVHEDDAILVLNKPANLVVHPGAGNPRHTLLNALVHHLPDLENLPRAGIVQRLDKDTTGLMVIAKTLQSHTYLVDRLQQRQVKRHYQAIVHGVMTAGGSVDAAISRHSRQRKRMAVNEAGKKAVTHYRVLQKFPAHTHVQLQLESGRTHQIRVHMAHIKYPIVGDPVYGGRTRLPRGASPVLVDALGKFRRQALHACELGLVHPSTGTEMKFEAPLPADMRGLLDILKDES